MLKLLLATALLVLPLCGYSQSYADSPLYKPHGSIKANGVVIDLFESVSTSAPGFEKIAGWSLAQRVDGTKPAQIFHFYIQFENLGVTFGYNLLAEPVAGTDRIKCTFSSLTDPPGYGWPRNKGIDPVTLSADLTPLVTTSGDTISITMLPLGQGKVALIQYLQLTLIDPGTAAAN
jgi:hypothetical protein